MLRDIYLLVENDNNERNKFGSFYDYVMMSPFLHRGGSVASRNYYGRIYE